MALRIDVLRPDDLLSFVLEGHNLELDARNASGARLVRSVPTEPATLVFVLPPQSFAEEALHEDDSGTSEATRPAGDLRSSISGPSRLAFRVPASVESIPYTVAGLLDWTALEPSLCRVAHVVGQPSHLSTPPPVVEPAATETSIELPHRVMLSPGPASRWRHPLELVGKNGRTELWHTDLVVPSDEGVEIRAVWSPDFGHPLDPLDPKLETSLTARHRDQLVRITSTFPTALSVVGTTGDLGKPALARRLTLSPLGGFLDATGSWPQETPGVALLAWEHHAALGRDTYVKVVERGRLFPLLHRATLIRITERRFEMSPPGAPAGASPTAYLRQFKFVTPLDGDLSYADETYLNESREMPFVSARMHTTITPKLNNPDPIKGEDPESPGLIVQTASEEIWVGTASFPFSLTGTDIGGNSVDFTAGLIFVPDTDLAKPECMRVVAQHYRTSMAGRKAARVASQRMTLAEPAAGTDTTTFAVDEIHFDAQLEEDGRFRPTVTGVKARIPAVETLTGSSALTQLDFLQEYLDEGFDDIAGVFAKVANPGGKLPVGFAADQAGGFVRPDLAVRGFARNIGPVAGELGAARAGTLDPALAFESFDAKLFGAIPLHALIDIGDIRDVSPTITTARLPSEAPTSIVTSLHWSLLPKPAGVVPLKFQPRDGSRLTIDALATQPLDGQPASTQVTGALNDFALELTDVARLKVSEFGFESITGRPTSVRVALDDSDPIAFLGALEFMHELAKELPAGIFGDSGPRITVAPNHIAVDLSLSLPPVPLGIFTLRHVAVTTGLRLPFLTGKPSFSIAFASREKPFELAVTLLGGGGFVRVETDTVEVRLVEAMLQFGGLFAYDLGVASGSVHTMAGIYVALKGQGSHLTGFVSIGGEMTILCIASASIEVVVSLSFYPGPPIEAKGAAEVSVSVKIAFISQSVSFTVEKSFSAGSEHISLEKVMTPAEWHDYAEAFA